VNRRKLAKAKVITCLFLVASALVTAAGIGFAKYFPVLILLSYAGVYAVIGAIAHYRYLRMTPLYYERLLVDPEHSVSRLAEWLGEEYETVISNVKQMIEAGYLGSCRFNEKTNCVVYQESEEATPVLEEVKAQSAEETREPETLREFRLLKEELERYTWRIRDADVLMRVERLYRAVSAIYDAVKQDPRKLPKIEALLSQHLPENIKMLEAYDRFAFSATPETLKKASNDMMHALDMLGEGYEKQLSQLHAGDLLDFSRDVAVLETMLTKDGLLDDGSKLRQMTSQK
jgi:5-bromo-4-chloroindolyl phosphate hydrolysis protein